uniref:C-type lectin domain-containing protein n=1 Tax=Periophthalmus magnuspinnatus TaxID=409849 RepID=A0A3B3ZZW3_9GOBI
CFMQVLLVCVLTTLTIIRIDLCYFIIPHINGLEYHFINQELNWHEAQQFCRENYLDLATVTSLEEAGALNRESYTGLAWIGLYNFNTWGWSATGTTLDWWYSNWKTNSPSGYYNCISADAADGKWYDHPCSHETSWLFKTATR